MPQKRLNRSKEDVIKLFQTFDKISDLLASKNGPAYYTYARVRGWLPEIRIITGKKANKRTPTKFSHLIRYLVAAKRRSESEKWNFDIDLEYLSKIWDSQRGTCAISGQQIIAPRTTSTVDDKLVPRWRKASLDRIDSSKPYIRGNVQFVSMMANYAKSDGTIYDLIKLCSGIVNKDIGKHSDQWFYRPRESLKPFNYFIEKAVKRNRVSVTSEQLSSIFVLQKGICPLTGANLILPDGVGGWSRKIPPNIFKASLDRISSDGEYTAGNVRFTSLSVNIARNNAEDDELLRFAQAVLDHAKKLGSNTVIHLITGVSGAGKSWVCQRLLDDYYVVEFDKIRGQEDRIIELQKATHQPKPILFDPPIMVETVMKNNPQFTWKLYVIQEDVNTVIDRLRNRGGQFTESVVKRMHRMRTLAKKAVFTGTSQEVLDALCSHRA